MDKAEAHQKLVQVLKEFTAPKEPFDEWVETPNEIDLDLKRFPVPELVLYGLAYLLDYPRAGHEEKVRWTVFGLFRDSPFAVQLAKFGPRLRVSQRWKPQSAEVEQLLVKLGAVSKIAEQYLEVQARDQIRLANVTITNRFQYLTFAYNHLRTLASRAYRKGLLPGSHEGSALASAMIDAYFSRLEHFLVLSLPFIPISVDQGRLQEFIGSKWSSKFKKVYECNSNKYTAKTFELLDDIKERIRNVLAHGAMEKNHGSFFVHVDGFGAIPASMTKIRKQLQFRIVTPPIDKTSFDELGQKLDSADNFLASGKTKYAWEWAVAGLDVRYDVEFRKQIGIATASQRQFEDLVERTSLEYERHINMNY